LLRGLLRVCVQIAIPVIGVFFLPGPLSIRVMTAALIALGRAVRRRRLWRRAAAAPTAPTRPAAPPRRD